MYCNVYAPHDPNGGYGSFYWFNEDAGVASGLHMFGSRVTAAGLATNQAAQALPCSKEFVGLRDEVSMESRGAHRRAL